MFGLFNGFVPLGTFPSFKVISQLAMDTNKQLRKYKPPEKTMLWLLEMRPDLPNVFFLWAQATDIRAIFRVLAPHEVVQLIAEVCE